MNQLPVLPSRDGPIALADIEQLERRLAQQIQQVDDIDQLREWRDQAAALETYLRGKRLSAPMLGAQRRVEARIGQLLGERPGHGPGRGQKVTGGSSFIPPHDRQRFRILARGFQCLSDEEWRSARDPLIQLIQERLPMPKHVPTVVTEDGTTRKPRAERTKEIAALAKTGHRAGQIADELGITEERVREIARADGISLPDHHIGKRAKIDPVRVLTETISGVDAY